MKPGEKVIRALNTYRTSNGITQAEVAEALSMSRTSVANLMRSGHTNSLELCLRIASYLETSLQELLESDAESGVKFSEKQDPARQAVLEHVGRAGRTSATVADLIGVSSTGLIKWLNKEINFSRGRMQAIANYLQVPMGDLLDE